MSLKNRLGEGASFKLSCKAITSLKVFAIVNSRSGPTGESCASQLETLFAKQDVQIKIVELDGVRSPKTLAEDAVRQKYDVIVTAGGDGTINAVASGMVGNSAIKLGIIPRGTLNHFAHALEIPVDIEKAVETIVAGHTKLVDVGQVNDCIFINNSSIGLYPAIVRMRENLQHSGLGKWPAALWASIRIFSRFRRLSLGLVTASGVTIRQVTSMLFIGNNAYETSFPALGQRPTLEGGKIWIMMPKSATRWGLIASFIKMISHRDSASDSVTMEANELTVHCKRHFIKVAIDGEVIQLRSPLRYSIRTKSLRVIVPAHKKLEA